MRQLAPRVARFRARRHPDEGPRVGGRRVAHPMGREKVLKPFGWLGHRAERIMDARPRDVAARHVSRPREGLTAGKTVPGVGGADESWGIHARARTTGSSDTANADKPAYPLSYNGAGEGMAPAPPSNPPRVALPWRSRMGAPPPSPRVGAA